MMRLMPWIAGVTLLLASTALADLAPPGEVERLRSQVAELQTTIAELERQNAVLRAQWGQATMEIDRLRAQIAKLKGGAATPDAAKPQVDESAKAQAAPASVERLRKENEDLRSRNQELTVLAGLGPQDERVAAQAARIRSAFDESSGRTVVRTEQEKLRVTAGSRADHFLSLAYSYEGETMAAAPREVTMFIQAVYSGGIYGEDEPLRLMVDGEAMVVPVAEYDSSRRSTRIAGRRRVRLDDETVTFLLDAEQLRRLARAVSVTGGMGVASFELTRDQIALFAAVKKRIEAGM